MRGVSSLLALVALVLVGLAQQGAATPEGPVPVAIMHGILGEKDKMNAVIEWVKAILPGKRHRGKRDGGESEGKGTGGMVPKGAALFLSLSLSFGCCRFRPACRWVWDDMWGRRVQRKRERERKREKETTERKNAVATPAFFPFFFGSFAPALSSPLL